MHVLKNNFVTIVLSILIIISIMLTLLGCCKLISDPQIFGISPSMSNVNTISNMSVPNSITSKKMASFDSNINVTQELLPDIMFYTESCTEEEKLYCFHNSSCFKEVFLNSPMLNCICSNGYNGVRCDLKIPSGMYSKAGITIGVLIAVIVVVVIIICLSLFLRNTYNTENDRKYILPYNYSHNDFVSI